jgi:diadenosine tetraphosphatase ApaH/serine/threonine PP2A family protein phosphatase
MIASRFSPLRAKRRPRVPDGVRIYSIGDIHGRADLLADVLERIDTDLAKNPIPHGIEIYLGDYIDRGPASREVLDRLVARKRTHRTVFLKGNHETFITDFVTNPPILEDWQRLGGLETLMSYGIVPPINANADVQLQLAAALDRSLPESHRQFLCDLKTSYTCGDFFFVHAGVRPGISLKKQREEDLLWIRRDFLTCEDDFGKIVVHGHTPVPQPDVRPNRINIDTGAYATGRLTCLVLEDDEMRLI